MESKRGGGTFRGNRSGKGPMNGGALQSTWNGTDKRSAIHQRRNRQRDRLFRNGVDIRITSIINLLLTADIVQIDDFDQLRIVKIRRRVVKRDMPILADPHANDIDLPFRKNPSITGDHLICRESERGVVEEVNVLKAEKIEKVGP